MEYFKKYKYMIIITEEDENNLPEEMQGQELAYFADNPWQGRIVGVYWGDTAEELLDASSAEGLFYQLYRAKDFKRLGYGICDLDSLKDDMSFKIAFFDRVRRATYIQVNGYVFKYLKERDAVEVIVPGSRSIVLTDYKSLDEFLKYVEERDTSENGFRVCSICGSPTAAGWTDEETGKVFCRQEEFEADMDERYGKGNWRPTPEDEYSSYESAEYQYREDENSPWEPESSYYTIF